MVWWFNQEVNFLLSTYATDLEILRCHWLLLYGCYVLDVLEITQVVCRLWISASCAVKKAAKLYSGVLNLLESSQVPLVIHLLSGIRSMHWLAFLQKTQSCILSSTERHNQYQSDQLNQNQDETPLSFLQYSTRTWQCIFITLSLIQLCETNEGCCVVTHIWEVSSVGIKHYTAVSISLTGSCCKTPTWVPKPQSKSVYPN